MNALDVGFTALERAGQLIELGRFAEALAVVGSAVAEPATAADAHLLRARCLLALRRSAEAIREAELGVSLDPARGSGHAILGFARLDQKQTRRALKCAREAARLDPLSVQAQYLIALCYLTFGVGYRGKARAAGQHALRLDPQLPLAYETAARAEAASGRRHRAAAVRYYRAGLALDPTDPDLALGLGDVLRRSRKHQQAGEVYVAAGVLDPTDPRARHRLARLAAPGAVGLGAAGKLALAMNTVRVPGLVQGHVLAVGAAAVAATAVGATMTTALKLRRNRTLPAGVRAALRSDYINSALVWVRIAALLELILALDVALSTRSGLPRPAALGFAALSFLLLWLSLHFRRGPRLSWSDARKAMHLRRRR
jgi:tetratricopeptide (TPR) repeat protein